MLAAGVLHAHAVERVLRQHVRVVDAEAFDLDGVGDDRDHRRALPRQADAADRVLEQLAHVRRRRQRRDRGGGVEFAERLHLVGRRERAAVRVEPLGRRGGRRRGGHLSGQLAPRHAPAAPAGRAGGGRGRGGRASREVDAARQAQPRVVRLGRQARVEFRLHGRPRHVERAVQVLDEADRPPADEAELHVGPVAVGLILDDRPPLQLRLTGLRPRAGAALLFARARRALFSGRRIRRRRRLVVARQDQSIARLPHRRLDHVPHAHAPLALPAEVDRHRLLVLIARLGQRGQCPLQLFAQGRVLQLQRTHLVEFHRADAGRPDEVQDPDLDDLPLLRVAGRLALLLDAEDRALHLGRLDAEAERDLRAAELAEQFGQRRVARDVDLEAAQRLGDRVLARVGDRRDLPVVEVLEDEALEDVVDLLRLEPQLGRAVAPDGAEVLEVADAAGEEHHDLHRHLSLWLGRLRLGRRWLWRPRRRGGRGELLPVGVAHGEDSEGDRRRRQDRRRQPLHVRSFAPRPPVRGNTSRFDAAGGGWFPKTCSRSISSRAGRAIAIVGLQRPRHPPPPISRSRTRDVRPHPRIPPKKGSALTGLGFRPIIAPSRPGTSLGPASAFPCCAGGGSALPSHAAARPAPVERRRRRRQPPADHVPRRAWRSGRVGSRTGGGRPTLCRRADSAGGRGGPGPFPASVTARRRRDGRVRRGWGCPPGGGPISGAHAPGAAQPPRVDFRSEST